VGTSAAAKKTTMGKMPPKVRAAFFTFGPSAMPW
jgi:hypothetical protein